MVTMTWNTYNTNVDLWVTEPDGEECGYSHSNTKSGGYLFENITSSYGPERYTMAKAAPGKYLVKVHYFRNDSNKLSDRTFVEITVTSRAGHPDERSQNFYTMLTSSQEKVLITEFVWPLSKD